VIDGIAAQRRVIVFDNRGLSKESIVSGIYKDQLILHGCAT
jgi:hypothetical protein